MQVTSEVTSLTTTPSRNGSPYQGRRSGLAAPEDGAEASLPPKPTPESKTSQYFRFGTLDNAFLVGPALLGFEIESWFEESVPSISGYGPLIGAVVGNAVSNGLAGVTNEGDPRIGAASFGGALIPLIPIAGAVAIGAEANAKAKTALATLSGGIAAWTIWKGYKRRQEYRQALSQWETKRDQMQESA